jgi:hypothetical protein
VDNPELKLKPGMTAMCRSQRRQEKIFCEFNAALRVRIQAPEPAAPQPRGTGSGFWKTKSPRRFLLDAAISETFSGRSLGRPCGGGGHC